MDPRFQAILKQLRSSLHPEVYKALALSRHVSQKTRFDSDGRPCASFGHQIRLDVSPDSRFSFFNSGLAMAAAGRSADIHYDNPLLRKSPICCPRTIFNLRQSWEEVSTSFATLGPPTSRTLARLWIGIKIFMETRVQRAETWGCPHILDACKQQLHDLKSIEEYSLKLMLPFPDNHRDCRHSTAHLHALALFLPFWSEHIRPQTTQPA